jgi:PIN domain nuclease of toxin-antitoxin system
MITAVADTQAIIWYINADQRLSTAARQTIDDTAASGKQVGFSTITLIEMIYLGEKQRIAPTTFQSFATRVITGKTVFLEIPLDYHVAKIMQQIDRNQIPDMPDRIIAATALALEVPLITSDGTIRKSSVATIW